MNTLIVMVLGIVQGLTEFLPVSSSGHLVLIEKLTNVQGNTMLLNIFLHLGTLLAVIVYYRRELYTLIRHPFNKTTLNLAIATVPTVIIVLLFKGFVDKAMGGSYLIVGFMITAFLLVLVSLYPSQKGGMNTSSALAMGIAQGIAIVPGISRSGATISTGLLCHRDREECTSFSFLMSIPIIMASLIYEIVDLKSTIFTAFPWWQILLGMAFAFIFGLIAIRLMLRLVKKVKLYYFSIYLVILSIVLILLKVV